MAEHLQESVTSTTAAKLTVEEKLRLLLDITKKISRSLDVDEVLNLVMDTLGTLIPYDAAGIFIADPGQRAAGAGTHPVASRGFCTRAVRGYDIDDLTGPHL